MRRGLSKCKLWLLPIRLNAPETGHPGNLLFQDEQDGETLTAHQEADPFPAGIKQICIY